MRIVRDLQEELELKDLQELVAELRVLLAQKDAHIEQLKRELYELQPLLQTCEKCHVALHKRKKGGIWIDAKPSKNATVCSEAIGDPACAARRKADNVAEGRAAKTQQEQVAANDNESVAD
jgi:ribosomal protein L37AE/L43A